MESERNLFIIAGDLNAKHYAWQNPVNNLRGISLDRWLQKNEHQYRIKLYCTQYPSYPLGNSYLDLFMADASIDFLITVDFFKLPNVPYDSDHNAAVAIVEIPRNVNIPLRNIKGVYKLNYSKTDWKKFEKTLEKEFTLEVPNDRNLRREETVEYLKKIDTIICDVRDKVVPKIKTIDRTDTYLTPSITELQKFKSNILTRLHRVQKKSIRIVVNIVGF